MQVRASVLRARCEMCRPAAYGAKRPFQTSAASDAGVLRDRRALDRMYLLHPQQLCPSEALPLGIRRKLNRPWGLLRPLPRYDISVRAHRCIERYPVLGAKRKTSARREYFAWTQLGHRGQRIATIPM